MTFLRRVCVSVAASHPVTIALGIAVRWGQDEYLARVQQRTVIDMAEAIIKETTPA